MEEHYRVEALRYLVDVGYPAENILVEPVVKRFGSAGRNSFRSDFAVLDVPVSEVDKSNVDELLEHALLLGEVKRDNAQADYVKNTQVRPMLDFAKSFRCVGLYWDNVEQRVFWQEQDGQTRRTLEGPLTFLPSFGSQVQAKPMTFGDTRPTDSLVDTFDRIEDILHQASFDAERRYEIILQLLLAKVFDEHAYEARPTDTVEIQDFSVLGTSPRIVKDRFNNLLGRAVSFYEKHLPNPVPKQIPVTGETLTEILKILAPIRIIHSKRDVVQTFYMKFAKDLYRWNLAQYFTPTNATDYIVQTLNPKFGEHVCDPACGSADFLVAAFRIGRQINPAYADCVWGRDNSANAVQVAVLNMLLNGDGKTNISKEDSLEEVSNNLEKYDIMVCNPPFGTRIVERRASVLRQYDLGHDWVHDDGKWTKTQNLLNSQETGILFAELCVKECKPGGRIGLIVPNGYLGNRSAKYRILREWLLRHVRIAAISSFPRFTFKGSGADVSASVLFMEKRASPLEDARGDKDYRFAVEMIEKVGWEAGNKSGKPVYKRNEQDGSVIVDENGEWLIDADFDESLHRIRAGEATVYFPWIAAPGSADGSVDPWTVSIEEVVNDPDLTLDPKRYSRKAQELRRALSEAPHYRLGDIVEFLPERRSSSGDRVRVTSSKVYNYVEIGAIRRGDFESTALRGWQLPDRAKHFAEPGDLYFGSIWGSVSKWCYIGEGHEEIVVTNGCFRCRLRPGKEDQLLDLIAYMSTEGWAVQLRALARGSDGLAEITADDASTVIIPAIEIEDVRKRIEPFVENLKKGRPSFSFLIESLLSDDELPYPEPPSRASHIELV